MTERSLRPEACSFCIHLKEAFTRREVMRSRSTTVLLMGLLVGNLYRPGRAAARKRLA